MAPDSTPDPPLDADAEAALARWLEAAAAGAQPDAAFANGRAELADFLAHHERLAELGSWWRAATGDEPAPGGAGRSTPASRPGSDGPQSDASTAALPMLPGYEISREIARGGMGVVYEARQTSLNRAVAVKLILHGALASPADRRRFAAEAAAAAGLKHPNIVVIHEVGEHAGQPYFSMEYVPGENLSRIIRRALPAPAQAAHYVAEVARAVQYAHDHGVLHRDIKPSNVLVDDAGRVRIMDFGLAKQLDAEADSKLTLSGQLLGTPSYMAPEQITGPQAAIGPACDVYGLGALLYELLTGEPPFREASPMETLIAALESDPALPRRLNPQTPRPLEMIALKCLEKEPAARYPTAAAVAADLDRYLQGETLSISSPHLLDRLVRTLERSQFDREIYAVSRMLLHVAWIALAAHTLVFVVAQARLQQPVAALLAIRTCGVAAMVGVLWFRRRDWYPPR
ncbi:MAG TPA: serine/threonine-protein kinase, partial [Lacipirellulaceae bacterium]|nr:serine/threonine-protein kinase [Lacipirellulaceae bacterium]